MWIVKKNIDYDLTLKGADLSSCRS
jgi:hypothetical protein